MKFWRLALFLPVWLTISPSSAAAVDSVRTLEIKECRSGEIATWGDGRDRAVGVAELVFAYNPANAPTRFPEAVVVDMVARAAASWSRCGIRGRVIPRVEFGLMPQGVIWVQWNETESRGNFGLSNPGQKTLSLSARAFDSLNAANPAYDARITLQMVISHEMGHLYGLMAHSRRCVDVLSYYDNGRGEKCFKRDPQEASTVLEYRNNFPTACDIARCRLLNDK